MRRSRRLAALVDGLPPKERAAVLLRYGYDLDYDQIARVLGSSGDAARQADIFRRTPLTNREEHRMTIPH